jgi:hypothetical protein
MAEPGMSKDTPAGDSAADRLRACEKRIEDLEGALEAAHNIIRQLRDKDSLVKEEAT